MSSETTEQNKPLSQYLNKLLKITVADGRTLTGTFLCTDKASNVILGNCEERFFRNGRYFLGSIFHYYFILFHR